MKINKKIFSLAMILPMSSSILAKPAFASEIFNSSYNCDKAFGVINEDIEINQISQG